MFLNKIIFPIFHINIFVIRLSQRLFLVGNFFVSIQNDDESNLGFNTKFCHQIVEARKFKPNEIY